jgi:CheY-like chemotaxis protein
MAAVSPHRRVTILMADDDEDDRQLAHDAFLEAEVDGQMRFVADGQELLDYLRAHQHQLGPEWPGIVLLDLNMPRKDGRETLAEIKGDSDLCEIPVVVLTTSRDQEDVSRAYCAGASSFISKPTSHAGLVDVMRHLQQYWFELVELPEA